MYIKAYQPFMSKFLTFWQKGKNIIAKRIPSAANVQFLTFESCLIVPVQRIPRYLLLINDLLKNTPESHTDHPNLVQALKKISAVASYVNDRQVIYEGIHKVLELNKRFGRQLIDDTGVTEFIRSHRRLIHQGEIEIEKNGKLKPAILYLLNDLIVVGSITEQKTEGDKIYSLICLWKVKLEDRDDNCFVFLQNDEEVLILHAIDESSKSSWLNLIEEALRKLNEAIMKGSDVETSKVHVDDNVQWNKALIPSEIAEALAAEQAQKRNHTNVVSLKSDEMEDLESVECEPSKRQTRFQKTKSIKSLNTLSKKFFDHNDDHNNSLTTKEKKPATLPRKRRSTHAASRSIDHRLDLSTIPQSNHQSSPTISQSARNPTIRESDSIYHEKQTMTAPTTPLVRVKHRTLRSSTSKKRHSPINSPRSVMGKLFVRGKLQNTKKTTKKILTNYLVLEARQLKKTSQGFHAFVQINLEDFEFSTQPTKKSLHPVWTEHNEFTLYVSTFFDFVFFLLLIFL